MLLLVRRVEVLLSWPGAQSMPSSKARFESFKMIFVGKLEDWDLGLWTLVIT